MRRKWIISVCVGGTLLLAGALWQISFSGADPAQQNGRAAGDEVIGAKAPAEGPLPIRRVVLFNTGVGYFQREGQVDGNARVELSFPAADMNDLLKSLILQDGDGGKVSTVSYDSHDPIEKTLRSFAIDLSANPTFGQILNQARGEKIEVVRVERHDKEQPDKKKAAQADVRTTKLVGTIIGMEALVKAGDPRESEILNLTNDAGVQAIPLEQVASVRFLNANLQREFLRALQILARAHDTQKKTVSVGFAGDGKRTVKVGYVVERPIWKTSYRLRIEDGNKLFMQAWAMVENTSDDDWNAVSMVLVAGRPISYKMNLYEPLYIPRPEVEPDLFASLRPPVYSGGVPPPPVAEGGPAVIRPMGMGMMGNPFMMMGNPFIMNQAQQPAGQNGQVGQGGGFNGNVNGGFGGNPFQNRYANPLAMQENFNAKLTYEQLQERRKLQREAKDEARRMGGAMAGLNFKEGIASVANAEEVGDYFQYALEQKSNLPRQKSAMLPIMNQALEGTKVSLYNAAVHAKYPLLGLRLKNTSGQPLTQGPITVYDGQTYAGDTRILDLQPGEQRYLSYALDQGTEVVAVDTEAPGPELYFKVGEAELAANYKVRHTRTYTLRNRSTHERAVVIEHPITQGWKVLLPEKIAEKARDVYRFEVAVGTSKTVVFKVTEEEERDAHVKFIVDGLARTCDPREDINVKLVSKRFEPRITGVRFEKGVLLLKQQVREATSYFVQNLSIHERQANIDYVVRPGWTLLLDDEAVKAGPAAHRVQLKLLPKKTAVKEFIEERTVIDRSQPLATLPEERTKELLASPVASPEVKKNLVTAVDMQAKLQEARKRSIEVDRQLRAWTDDQARMRQNLIIIPQSSEHYKKFLEKFVGQETQIETLQKQARDVQAAVQTMQRDYDQFIANLTVD